MYYVESSNIYKSMLCTLFPLVMFCCSVGRKHGEASHGWQQSGLYKALICIYLFFALTISLSRFFFSFQVLQGDKQSNAL